MAQWASTEGYSTKVNWLMVCVEVGTAGLRTAQRFGRQFQLPPSLINGYIEQRSELPRYGQLGCQGFIVLGLYGEFTVQRSVPCYLDKGPASFKVVEKLLSSQWSIEKPADAPTPRKVSLEVSARTGVPELDSEHSALDELAFELRAGARVESLKKLLKLWRRHSEHEEQLFDKFDFGGHRTGGGSALTGTASHCQHHRLIAEKMELALRQASTSMNSRVPADAIETLVAEMQRHEIYDAAYAGHLPSDGHRTARPSPGEMSVADAYGWYDFSWTGGVFEVCFRPGGHFFCPKFRAAAKWELDGDSMKIDWANFGKYEMTWNKDAKAMDGMCISVKSPTLERDWRRATFKKPLSSAEVLLFGDGAGTEWDLKWAEGEFPIQFKCDGYNTFKCAKYPADSHWSLEGEDTIKIFWGEYGNYQLKINHVAKTMSGSVVGETENWRTAKYYNNIYHSGAHEVADHH